MGCRSIGYGRIGRKFIVVLLVCAAVLHLPSCANCKPFPSLDKKAGLVFPVHVRHGVTRARSLLRNGSLPVLGEVYDVGYFYTHLWLGTPPRHFSVIIDTGSTITYIPCNSCHHCGRHQDSAFDPRNSSTYKSLECTSPKCKCGSPPCSCVSKKCYYYRSYAEHSSSAGWLIEDAYYFPDNVTSVPVVFGCEDDETGEIYKQMADGILGMGKSNIAFHSQLYLAGVTDNTFGLCFAWPSGGAMLLGDVSLPNVNMTYSPMVAQPMHQQYYNIKLTGIRVGDQLLNLPYRELFDSGMGTILDSGTTFTYFPTPAYEAFKSAIGAAARGQGLQEVLYGDSSFKDYCWKGAAQTFEELERILPTAEILFDGNATFRLTPYRYLFLKQPGIFCLGILDNFEGGALIGGITVRNVLVQYDAGRNRYGFGEADCTAIGEAAAVFATNPLPRSIAAQHAPVQQKQAPSRPSPSPPLLDPPTPISSSPKAIAPQVYAIVSVALIAMTGLVTLALYLLRHRTFGYMPVGDMPMDQHGEAGSGGLPKSSPQTTNSLEMSPQTNSLEMSPQTNSLEMSPQTNSLEMSPQTNSLEMSPQTNSLEMSPQTNSLEMSAMSDR